MLLFILGFLIGCDDQISCLDAVQADGDTLTCDGGAVQVCYSYTDKVAADIGRPSACWYETSNGAYPFDCDEATDGRTHQDAGAELFQDCAS